MLTKDMEQQELSFTVSRNAKMVQPLYKTVRKFLRKLSTLLPYDPPIMLLGIINITKELKIYIHTKTHTQVFIAALFVIAKLGSTKLSFSR